eukprot:3499379-Pyramimonas_sp.AAC.1
MHVRPRHLPCRFGCEGATTRSFIIWLVEGLAGRSGRRRGHSRIRLCYAGWPSAKKHHTKTPKMSRTTYRTR